MRTVFRTDRGRIRNHNEDNGGIFSKNGQILAVVVDGMGGHKAGDVASKMALDLLKEAWQSVEEPLTKQAAETWLAKETRLINKKLFEHANANKDCEGMGTTLVAAFCDETFVVVANVGDSRCYLLNADATIKQKTEDHSLVNELVRAGELTAEDAELHPGKHVLMRALGTEKNIEVDTFPFAWNKDDLLLLCSDGLSNKLDENTLRETLLANDSFEAAADQLVTAANQAGGEDNITLTIVQHAEGDSE